MVSEDINNEERSAVPKISRRGKQSGKAEGISSRKSTTKNREEMTLDSNLNQRTISTEETPARDLGRGQLAPIHSPLFTNQPQHALQDYQTQIMLTEQLNKRLLLEARQGRELSGVGENPPPTANHALQDYQTQIMLTEQHNKRLLLESRQGRELAGVGKNPPSTVHHALQDYNMQLLLLEQQNKKRNLTARQEENSIDTPIQLAPKDSVSRVSPLEGVVSDSHLRVRDSIEVPRATSTIQDSFHLNTTSEALPMSFDSSSSKRKATEDDTSSACIRARAEELKRRRNQESRQSEYAPDSRELAVDNLGHFDEFQALEVAGPSGTIGIPEEDVLCSFPTKSTPRLAGFPSRHDNNTQEPTDHAARVEQLLRRVSELEDEDGRLKRMEENTRKRPRVHVLHVLDSEVKTTCLERPTWTSDSKNKLQLKAESPLLDYEQYLLRNPDIVCVVYKSYSAPQTSRNQTADALVKGTMPSPTPDHESMELRSDEMRTALELFLEAQDSFQKEFKGFSFSGPISAPYLFWYRYKSNVRAFSDLEPAHRLLMKTLTDWIETNYKAKYEHADSLLLNGRVSQECMEFLFRTGEVIVSKERGQIRAYLTTGALSIGQIMPYSGRAQDTVLPPKPHQGVVACHHEKKAPWNWHVPCWSIGYDGQFYKAPASLNLQLDADTHKSEVNIQSLNVFPLRLASEDVRRVLAQRGRTFWYCRVPRYVVYQANEEEPVNNDGEKYMIDFASYKSLHPEKQVYKRTVDHRDDESTPTVLSIQMNIDGAPSEPLIYLFPSTLFGYSLRRKTWVDLSVHQIRGIVWSNNAFDYLVANEEAKDLVQALVSQRIPSKRNTDIIRGKGNGIIMLLHGGPGTGKTFTAECVAEMARKPLYPITCGDLGTEPEQMEKHLESVLDMAKLWDCVVLFDDADVFLEERTLADLARNALASVFLRTLEYYDGILILTSNRVTRFDEAFRSRISLSLHYPEPTKLQRCRIWKNFLNRLKVLREPDIDFDDIECAITKLASEELNGRQIRNAITLGRQLAKFKKTALSSRHLHHVIKVSGQFETSIKNTNEGIRDN